MNTFKKGQMVCNTRTGDAGIVIGIWTNIANQTVLNVRIVGINQTASWNTLSVEGAE